MLVIIQKYKEKILLGVLLVMLLPVFVSLQEVIVTIGQHVGTALRMYAEGVCVK